MNDLERKLLEQVVRQLEKDPGVSDDDKREMRESLLALKLLDRIPQGPVKPAIWQDSRFWTLMFAILALAAAVFGVQIPRELLGGK